MFATNVSAVSKTLWARQSRVERPYNESVDSRHINYFMVVDFLKYLSITLFHNNMKDKKLLTILQSEWYDFLFHGLYYSASGSTGEYLPKVDCLRGRVFFWFSLKFNFNRLNIRTHIYIERYIMGLVEMTTFTMKLIITSWLWHVRFLKWLT